MIRHRPVADPVELAPIVPIAIACQGCVEVGSAKLELAEFFEVHRPSETSAMAGQPLR